MGLVRSLFAKFTTRVDSGGLKRFNSSVGRTKKELNFAAREAKRARRQFNQLAFAAKAGIAAFVGGRIIRTFTTDFSKQADTAARMSKSLGVSTKFLTGFQHAIQGVGIEGDETDQIIADISERMFDASEGSKALADDFKLIGLQKDQLKELAKAGPEKMIMALADAMQTAGPGAERTFVAMSGLGDVGKRLLPLLEQGSAGIRAQLEEAEKLGVVMDDSAAKMGKNFNRQLFKTKQLAVGLRNQIAKKLLPAIGRTLTRFNAWAMESGNVERALTRLKLAGVALMPILALLASAKVVAAFVAMKGAILALVSAIKAMGLAAMGAQAKLLLIPLALAGIVALLEDIYTFSQGGDSYVGDLFGDSKEAKIFLDVLREIGAVFGEIGGELGDVFGELGDLLAEPFRELWKLIRPLAPYIGKTLRWALIGLAAVVWLILKAVVVVIRAIRAMAKWTWNDATKAVTDGLLAAWQWLGKVVAQVWEGIKEMGETAAEVTSDIWGAFVWALGKALQGIVWLWDQIAGAGKSAGNAVGALWKGMIAAVAVLIAGLRSAWSAAKNAASWAAGAARSAWQWHVGKIRLALDTLSSWKKTKSAAAAAASWTRDKFLAAARAIRGAFEKVNSKIKETLKNAGGKVKKAITYASDRLQTTTLNLEALRPQALQGERTRAAIAGATPAAAGPTSISITAPISVSGSLNMDSAETAAKLKAAAQAALGDVARENFADRRQVVRPAPTSTTST